MIKTASTAWKTSLRTGSLADRDYRLYADFRQKEYPDLGTGSAQYTVNREDNLFDRGNCSSPIPPMIFDETVPVLYDATFARSSAQAHTGDYSYLCTKTNAPPTVATILFTDSLSGSDMHGFVAGTSYTVSWWGLTPSSGGPLTSETNVGVAWWSKIASAYVYTTATIGGAQDVWGQKSFDVDIGDDAGGVFLYLQFLGTASAGEYVYIDDLKLTSHTVPGSHALTGGFTEHLLPLPDTFTLRIKFKGNFAFDTAIGQTIVGWYVSATQYFYITYSITVDKFWILYREGGAGGQYIQSAQYDDGTSYRNIGRYQTLTAAVDLTTGTTGGSSLWMDGTLDGTTWNDSIGVKSSVLNKMQTRAYAGNSGDYDIAFMEIIPNYICTAADILNDLANVKNERIYFDFNGHGTGRTRCNISTPASRTLTKYDLYKGITSRLNASYGTNTLNCTLRNDDGRFSDDQNAAWDPANSVYNGTNAQNYLQQRFGVELESWYSNDFDTVFLGRSVEGGLSRTSKMKTVSTVNLSAEDGVGDLDRSFEENGRVFPSSMLVRSDTLIDRGGCESTTAPSMLGESSATLSNATFARSTGQVYHGRYSYLLTKTIAAGTAATVTLADSVAGGDTHGMTASATYTLSMKVYIPSGAMLGSEFVIALVDSIGAGTQAATNVYDSWQHVSISRGGHAFTYAYPQIQIAAAAAINETVYIDDIKLVPDDLSEATDNSLFHKIAKRGYRKTIQYLSNNSFENADITLSWLVSTGGTLNRDAADGFFGSVSGELIPGAAEEYAYQQVTFLLTCKLNVGDKFNFSCYLKSTAAATGANNYLRLYEKTSPSTNNAYTDESYTLAGGEGYKRFDVSHTITTSTSNLLQVEIWADAGDTINIDGAMLTPTEEALNYFVVNALNGTAGVSLADLGVEISYPWHGFKTRNVDYIHPWRRMDQNTTVWQNIKSVGTGTGARYCGMDESGALVNYSILDNDFSDAVPIGELTDVSTDLNYARHDGISIALDALSANKLYGLGDKYEVGTVERLIWLASSTGNFAESTADQQLAESVLASAYWPNPDDYAEYWAEYGANPDKYGVNSNLTALPLTMSTIQAYKLIHGTEPTGFMTMAMVSTPGLYKQIPVSKRDRIVGIQSAKLIHKTTDAGDGDGSLSYVTAGLLSSGLDLTSKAGQARILLQNDTEGTLVLVDAGIVGKAVYKFTGSEGFIHDGYIDRADIAKNGERLITFGGEDVIDGAPNGQLDRLADFIWKDRGTRKHLYVIATVGAPHDLSPADWINLDIGAAGTAENIASLAEIQGMRISQTADSHGTTQTTFREVEEGWKYDSNVLARFLGRGVPTPTHGSSAFVTVGSEYAHDYTDIRIPNGSTTAQVQINAAIDFLSNTYNGGTVYVGKGTYKTSAAIVMKSNIHLQLDSKATIEKNGNFNGITATGGSGTELTGIKISGGKITRNAADTNAKQLILFTYVDDSEISGCLLYDGYDNPLKLSSCDNTRITECTIDTCNGYGIYITGGSVNTSILNNTIKNVTNGSGIFISNSADNETRIVSNVIHTVVSTSATDYAGIESRGGSVKTIVTSNTIHTLSASSTGQLWGIKLIAPDSVIQGNIIHTMVHTGTNNVSGIDISAERITADDNAISGITVNNGASAGGANGIFIPADESSVVNNAITDITITAGSGTARGIWVFTGKDGSCVQGNRINTVDDIGVDVDGSYNTITGSTIDGVVTGINIGASATGTIVDLNGVQNASGNAFLDAGTNTIIGG